MPAMEREQDGDRYGPQRTALMADAIATMEIRQRAPTVVSRPAFCAYASLHLMRRHGVVVAGPAGFE